MTKLRSLLHRVAFCGSRDYASALRLAAVSMPGVYFTIRRMSLGRRIELARSVRDLLARLEFHQAGKALDDQVEGALLAAEIEAVYLRWGLIGVEHLTIDAQPPSCETLIAAAPEALVHEIVGRIKSECGLSEQETKN